MCEYKWSTCIQSPADWKWKPKKQDGVEQYCFWELIYAGLCY